MAELSKEAITAWRDFSVDPAFEEGLAWLIKERCPRVKRNSSIEDKLHDALEFGAYQNAIDDVRLLLTNFPAEAVHSVIPPLER